ncbi:O-antigen ligase family protein, partial [Puniceibacterium confluentis]|uniref:O-antigen ligase family protein n=1 Tax=Puniceibacterium confluentis TaxID=1958944 RepID=UPI003569F503
TVVLTIGFRLGPLYMTTLRLFLIVMIVPLMLRLLSGAYGRVFVTDILFVLHILWAAAAIGVNNPDQVVQQVGSVGIEFLGGYVVGRAYIRTPETFAALCRILIVMVLCSVPFALHETLTGRPLIVELLRKLPGMTSVAIVSIESRMGLERVQAVFAHPIHYGLFCSVAFSLCFVALRGAISNARRYATSTVIAATGFLALSSGALTAIAMQIGLIAWASMFREVKQRWWLLIGLFALMYLAIDLLSNRSPLQVFMSYATFSAHNAYWRAQIFEWGLANVIGSAEKEIVGSPLTGIGLNDWVRPHYMYSGSMDNFWLVMTVRYGLPGFFFLAVGYVVAIARIMRRNFEQDARLTLFRRAWVFTFLGLTFTLCTVHVWSNIYSFIFFMFGAGMWLITVQPGEGRDQIPAPAPLSSTRFAARQGDTLRTPDSPAPAAGEPTGHAPARGMTYSRFPPRHPPRDRS